MITDKEKELLDLMAEIIAKIIMKEVDEVKEAIEAVKNKGDE